MCGRYTLSVTNKPDVAKLGLQSVDRFNIAPQSPVLIRESSGDHVLAHWGIPLKGSGSRKILTNARSETLREKPLFRDLSRCAFLADGWYEWQRSGSQKQPWYHHCRGKLFYMAGVSNPDKDCAVVTQPTSAPLSKIHQRQPVLLDEEYVWVWLDGAEMSESAPEIDISCHPVAARVGNTRHDDGELMLPVDVELPPEGRTGELFPDSLITESRQGDGRVT